jgi:hypothetical protein
MAPTIETVTLHAPRLSPLGDFKCALVEYRTKVLPLISQGNNKAALGFAREAAFPLLEHSPNELYELTKRLELHGVGMYGSLLSLYRALEKGFSQTDIILRAKPIYDRIDWVEYEVDALLDKLARDAQRPQIESSRKSLVDKFLNFFD